MTEEEFHRQRRMFAIVDGKLEIAEPGDHRDHQSWFRDMCWTDPRLNTGHDKFMEDTVRGFVDDRGLFAYRQAKGNPFSHFGVAHKLYPFMAELKTRLNLPDKIDIWFGVKPATDGDARWPGKAWVGNDWQEVIAKLSRCQLNR
jgi:hypothetical protein